MQRFLPLETEIDRVIRTLGVSSARISLLAITAGGMPIAALQAAVRAAATTPDIYGMLPDGSVGLLFLDAQSGDDATGGERRFLPRLRAALGSPRERSDGTIITLWIRSVQRCAAELSGAADLVQSLFDAAPSSLVLPTPARFRATAIINRRKNPARPAATLADRLFAS